MRKRLTLALTLGAVIALAVAAVAVASNSFKTTVRFSNLELTFSGKVTPKALPKKKYAPVGLHISANLKTTDGSHPPALKEIINDVDKNGMVDAKGLAVCKPGQLVAQDSKHAEAICKKAKIGQGTVNAEIAFAESKPVPVKSKLLAFNGGVKGGVTTLLIHAYITVPAPAAVVTRVKITKEHKGRYGEHAVSSVPVIVGGSGSVTSFNLTLFRKFTYKGKQKSYFVARCPDGHFNALADVKFRNGDDLKGGIVVPCKSKG